MRKENVLIKVEESNIKHVLGVYGIYYKKIKEEIMLYIGGGDIADCYNRHDSLIKYGNYAGTNKDILNDLFAKGVVLYFKVIEFCNKENATERETFYINLYRNTICNGDSKGKRRTTNVTLEEHHRRVKANSGENNPRCRLSNADIERLRMMMDSGEYRDKELAKMFNISLSYISNLRHNNRRKKETDTIAM